MSFVTVAAIDDPASRPVEGLALVVAGDGPEDRFSETEVGQGGQCGPHEQASDADAPVSRIDRDRVELAERRIDGIATRADADETDDEVVAALLMVAAILLVGDPPTLGSGGEIGAPSLDPGIVERARPHEMAEARVP